MSNTRVVSSTNLVGQESIQFIRPNTLILTLIEARPNTKVYVFFDNENVTDKCHPAVSDWSATKKLTLRQVIKSGNNYYQVTVSGTTGTTAPTHTSGTAINGTATLQYVANIATLPLITDTIGQIRIQFNLPGGTYTTGDKNITIADTNVLSQLQTVNSVFGSAKGTFRATGRIDIFQETKTTITTVERVVNVQRDPLAQSFFTYGVTGGLFLSSIDVYFQTKDTTLPVRLELRKLINGSPESTDASSPYLVSVLEPSQVNVSANASIATKFKFEPPIYLEEESDYCFVLRSNSNNYNVFTSRMNEVSIEDGRKIFDQPYIGSLFKSENGVTWTEEQFEDIKFTINKCVFDTTSQGTAEFTAVVPYIGALGTQFSTVSGSKTITYVSNHEHGLEVGSKFKVVTRSDSLYANASFNGIPYTQFNATHTVTSVPNRNTITFNVTNNATSTGPIETGNVIDYIGVNTEGVNYSSSDTISFIGGGGSGAAATLNVVDGKIKSVTITNAGTNYTSPPELVINTSTGTGASLFVSVLPTFSILSNKPMTGFTAKMNIMNYGESSTNNILRTTLGNYDGGNLVTYNSGTSLSFVEYVPYVNMEQNSLIASTQNEQDLMSGNVSAKVEVSLSTTNPNVSPVINLTTKPLLLAHYNKINTQVGETLSTINQTSGLKESVTNSSGSIDSIGVTSAGSGYTIDPVVTISAPDLPNGVQATATAARVGSSVSEITVTNAGSGYTSTPLVTITRASGDTTGTGAAAQALLTPFNTELLPTGGSAKARYISKTVNIKIVSTGIRLFSTISSVQGSSVDWYVRTSLTGSNVVHDEQTWKRLNCQVDRDRSSYIGEQLEYEFYLNDIDSFDTYDLKCVMTATDPTKAPVVYSYRVIVLA